MRTDASEMPVLIDKGINQYFLRTKLRMRFTRWSSRLRSGRDVCHGCNIGFATLRRRCAASEFERRTGPPPGGHDLSYSLRAYSLSKCQLDVWISNFPRFICRPIPSLRIAEQRQASNAHRKGRCMCSPRLSAHASSERYGGGTTGSQSQSAEIFFIRSYPFLRFSKRC